MTQQDTLESETDMSTSTTEVRELKTNRISAIRRFYAKFSNRKRLWQSAIYDIARYSKWSFALRRPHTQRQMEAFLTMQYHSLEKGLALGEPRVGFGRDRISALCTLLEDYVNRFGHDELTGTCIAVLKSYKRFSESHGYTYDLPSTACHP